MIITQEATFMNILAVTDISLKITVSSSPGQFTVKQFMYEQTNYTHARTCNIGTNTLIGSSTQVAENVQIIASVIGQNCTIGAGSVIRNSYIFENTVIGARCVVERSIIGASVMVKDGSHVPVGCLIGEGVMIGPDAILEPYERLSVKRHEIIGGGSGDEDGVDDDHDDDDSDIEEVEASEFNLSSKSLSLSH
jgi:translation initiation factor eIF-2B subunit epsilon